jgi:hypothetical protein
MPGKNEIDRVEQLDLAWMNEYWAKPGFKRQTGG